MMVGFMLTAGIFALEVYLSFSAGTPLIYAATAFVGAMLLFQAALMVRRR